MHVTKGWGAEVLVSTSDKSNEEILLTNALYSPNARHNLMCVLRVTEHGVGVCFLDQVCTLKKNSKIIDIAVKIYGPSTRQGTTLSVSEMNHAYVWHKRLAHMNATDLAKLVSQDFLAMD
jgi:hypothetical protein